MNRKSLLGMFFCFLVGAGVNSLFTPGFLPGVDAGCTDNPCDNPPCCNGDVNGDGKINLSDAVSLLSYLFSNGEEAAEIEIHPEIVTTLFPSSGQQVCYDDMGQRINCNSAEFPGQDGFYKSGCSREDRFTDNGDGTITDNCTGLMWLKQSADLNGNGIHIGDEDLATWQEALKFCDDLEFANHSDWRLPSIMELISIINFNSPLPTTYPEFDIEWGIHFSSSTSMKTPSAAWSVSFRNGNLESGLKTDAYWVLPVRTK